MTDVFVKNNELKFNGKIYKCAFGKNGFTDNKIEGDNKTPIGCFELREVFYKNEKPKTKLPTTKINENLGWCDDVESDEYNQLITLPHAARHEKMLRDDELYDLVLVIGYNDNPPEKSKGSAIFMHIAKPKYAGTEGCIALKKNDLIEVLAGINLDSKINITSP